MALNLSTRLVISRQSSSLWRTLSTASLILSPILTIFSTVATGSAIETFPPHEAAHKIEQMR